MERFLLKLVFGLFTLAGATIMAGCSVETLKTPPPDTSQPELTYDPTNISTTWAAYHNCMSATGNTNNVTAYTANDSVGFLHNFADDSALPITVRLNYTNISSWPSGGSFVMSNDVYNTFNGILDLNQNASYNSSSDSYVEVTLSNLDPGKKYMFVTTGNRNNIAYLGDGASSRWAKFSIVGADTYDNFSSAGVIKVSESVVKINTGYNNTNGHVAAWINIIAADGVFTVRSENVGAEGPGDPYKSYGIIGFKFAEMSN